MINWGISECTLDEIIQILNILSKLSRSQLYSYSWYCYNQIFRTVDLLIFSLEGCFLNENTNSIINPDFPSQVGRTQIKEELEEFKILSEKVQHIRFQDERQSQWDKNQISKHLHWLGDLSDKEKDNFKLTQRFSNGLSWSGRLLSRMERSVMVVPDVNQCIGHAFAFAFLQKVVVEPTILYELKLNDVIDKTTNVDNEETEFGKKVGYKSQNINGTQDKNRKVNSLKAIRRMLPNLGFYIIRLARLQRMGTIWCNSVLSISVGNTRKFLNGLLPVSMNLLKKLNNKLLMYSELVEFRDGSVINLSEYGNYVKKQSKAANFANRIFGNLYEYLNTSWRIIVITSILVPYSKKELVDIVEHKYGATLEALRKDTLNKRSDIHDFEWPLAFNQDINNFLKKNPSVLTSLFDTLDEYWNTCASLHPILHKICLTTNKLRDILSLLELPSISPVNWERFKLNTDRLEQSMNKSTFQSATTFVAEGVFGNPKKYVGEVEWDYTNYQQLKLCGIDASSSSIISNHISLVDQSNFEGTEYINSDKSCNLYNSNNVPLCGVCAFPVSTESTVRTQCRNLTEFKYVPKSTLVRGRWYHKSCLELINSESERENHSLFVLPKVKIPQVI
ncbi:hypothetical protein FG386_000048 [Cryptosporidium ryanae]|uniref:uncharacterized protein n=1 Tax=Cryptosporidium ryanae TaxID=515981 RepID=UPI003519F875|nr:hypothetical protein FG386_000048 [Cryptosporidium ryanae]